MSNPVNNGGNGIVGRIAVTMVCALITVVTTLSLFITAGLRGDIQELDNKVFMHLTNHEIHIPRDIVVTQAEFDLYTYTSEKNLERLVKEINKR